MGTPRFELGTSALSGRRSNRLSYMPNLIGKFYLSISLKYEEHYNTYFSFVKGGAGIFLVFFKFSSN